LDNAWGSGGLTYGTDYTISATYSKSDVVDHTTFNWSYPTASLNPPKILAYPDVTFGPSPTGGGVQTYIGPAVFPLQVGAISTFQANYNLSLGGDTSGYDVAFDMWLTNTPGGGLSTITNEVMVWVHKGGFGAPGNLLGSYTDDGATAKVYYDPSSHYTAVIFDADHLAGTVDVAKLLGYLESRGVVAPSEYFGSIHLGAEVASGGGYLTVNHLDLNVTANGVNYAVAGGGLTTTDVAGTGATTSATPAAANPAPVETDGGPNADTLTGASQNNILFGGGGDDSLVGGAGFNRINGNQGADTIAGHSTVGDWLLGGQGDDLIDASASSGHNILNGNLGNDTLIGGSGADTLRGGQGDDVIHAGAGNDWISGDLGNNTLYGGQGMDTFAAGAGHDVVNGWHAGDHVLVGAGVTWTVSQVNADVHVGLSTGGEIDLIGVQASALPSGWIGAA
jgi:Ca2+-binding RTX toxin-like protein